MLHSRWAETPIEQSENLFMPVPIDRPDVVPKWVAKTYLRLLRSSALTDLEVAILASYHDLLTTQVENNC
jgi:hypothetical protein